MIADKSRELEGGAAPTSQLQEWLQLFPQTGAQRVAGESRPFPPFSQWCCVPLVALAVIGDILVQFLR